MNEIIERCDFNVGDWITEKYCIRQALGEGNFGKVYKVKTRHSGQEYALKLFKFWEMIPTERESMYARFLMEFETGQIKSPYLVQSEEYGHVKGNPFLVMELCTSGDLQHFVRQQKEIDFGKIGKEILCGLKDLHSRGKAHRDLKPENVLIKSDGTAALTDFGLSGDKSKRKTEVDFFGKPTFIAGTPAYMAPEQARPKNKEVTVLPTMDIFAFGVMMYYMITQKFPFGELNNENDMVLYFRNVREGKWNRERLIRNTTGKKFENVIAGCLKSDYKQRLQTVDAVLSLMPEPSVYNSSDDFNRIIKNGVLLRVMQGEEHGAVHKLNDLIRGQDRVITVGRNDAQIFNILPIVENNSSFTSRKHCTLELGNNNQWFIRDGQWDKKATNGWRKSCNGTFVNSKEANVDGMQIHPGDIITIGDVKLRVEGY